MSSALHLLVVVALGCLLGSPPSGATEGEEARTIRYRVLEEQDPGTFVGNVRQDAGVEDRYDRFVVDQVRFRLMSQPEWTFILEETSGIIRTGDRIDRDRTCPQKLECAISLDVVVIMGEGSRFLEIVKVWVDIIDSNDNQPYFSEVQIQRQILESALPGTGLVIPTAIDPDSGANGIQQYELISSDRMFRLDVEDKLDGSTKVLLVLQGRLDREAQDFYEMKVVAHDGGNPPRSGSVEIFVSVQDANDNSPKFDNTTYEFVIFENVAVGTNIGRVHATDRDAGANGQILYSLSSQTQAVHGRTFGVRNNTGEIYVRGEVDFEEHPIYTLSVTARDKGADSLPVDATVVIRVIDVNDHPPVIKVNTLAAIGVDQAEVEEDADMETFVAHITVTDEDQGRNGNFNCSLDDNHFQLQKLYESEYKIVTRALLDRELRSEYNLAIKCEDFGKEPQVAIKHIRVLVVDVNDNVPVFTKDVYTSSLIENNYMGVFVVQVNATDRDEGRNADIRYSLDRDAGDYFDVDQYSGSISARAVFDREKTQQLSFHVIASDRGQPRKKTRAQVIVTINDVNDEYPKFSTSSYSFGVYENEPAGTEVGFVHAVDTDSTPYKAFTFSFADDRVGLRKFEINPYTGRITTKVELDREEKAVYYLIVVAKDGGSPPMSSTASVSIYVADKNDNPPVFDFPSEQNNTIHISNKSPLGYIITKVQAYDRDYGSNGNLTYSILSGNEAEAFRMDPSSGTIAVHKDLKDINFYLYELTIQVADNGPTVKSVTTSLNIMVNKSIAFPLAEPHILTGHNFTIVITLACGSGVVVVILIIAIICIRRQDMERRHHKYNCRMEALKMLHSREVPKDSDDSCSGKGVGMHNSNCSSGDERDRPKKEVSFNLECEDTTVSVDKYGSPEKASHRSWPSTIDHRTLEVSGGLDKTHLVYLYYDHIPQDYNNHHHNTTNSTTSTFSSQA